MPDLLFYLLGCAIMGGTGVLIVYLTRRSGRDWWE